LRWKTFCHQIIASLATKIIWSPNCCKLGDNQLLVIVGLQLNPISITICNEGNLGIKKSCVNPDKGNWHVKMDTNMTFDTKWSYDIGFDNLIVKVKRLVEAKYRG
jgi:hypothetical protein